MPEGSIILDRAYFDSAEWTNQAREQGGFGPGAAWVDLLALANQKDSQITVRGILKSVERGQCGWSKLGLANRWGWSQGKTAARLAHWEKIGRLTINSGNDTTILTILNYDLYQTSLLRSLVEHNENSLRAGLRTECEQVAEQTETEKGEGRGSTEVLKGEGRGDRTAPPPTEIPDDLTIKTFCAGYPGDMARGIPAGIPEVWWSGWVANRLQDEKKWPRDWQRVLVLAFRADFLNRHPKALGHLTHGTAANGSPLSVNVTAIQAQNRAKDLGARIAALENEVHQDRVSNMPREPKKIAGLEKLRAELAALTREAA